MVLPMLEAEVVGSGWLSAEQFLGGYGVTQAMPGPIFTLAGNLGAQIGANIAPGAASFFAFSTAALLGIFLPSFAFIAAFFPLYI